MYPGETFKFTHQGREFTARIQDDNDGDTPWERWDNHGEVSECTGRDKKPGELVLIDHRHSVRFYDYAGTLQRAKTEGWGLSPEHLAKLGTTPTRGQIAHAAVMLDFQRIRAWCNDKWCYVGIVVSHGGHESSAWGFESDMSGSDFLDNAKEIAEEILSEISASTYAGSTVGEV